MNNPVICHDEQRRQAVRDYGWNGIDYLEVSDDQRTLTLYFLGPAPADLTPANIRIDGGVRVRAIRVVSVRLCRRDDPELDDCLQVTVDRPGDFSTYTLRLVEADAEGAPGDIPFDHFDPRYARIEFSFKIGCASDLDCAPEGVPSGPCPPPVLVEPEINYLGKDYAAFRRLILDRLALIMPQWRERHVPDFGIAMAELLAYTGDYLSYYQDAIATEAYLATARQRISVRRHARLVDYRLHEGCNARAWLHIATEADRELPPRDLYFITGIADTVPDAPAVLRAADLQERPLPSTYETFEPVGSAPIRVYAAHNEIPIYTWGDQECCLLRGATRATLLDEWLPWRGGPAAPGDETRAPTAPQPGLPERLLAHLQVGDLLLFEEIIGPRTGDPADADPAHRHVVRLTRVEPGIDGLYTEPTPAGRPIVEIEWDPADALPFPLCLSAVTQASDCRYIDRVSVARGNILLVDHGATRTEQTAPVPVGATDPGPCDDPCGAAEPVRRAGLFRPRLEGRPVTHQTPHPTPAHLAQAQARILGGLMDAVYARLQGWWVQARQGHRLSAAARDELRAMFGAATLRAAGLPPPEDPPNPEQEAAALQWLIGRATRLLAPKARRIGVLAARARAGVVLGAAQAQEIQDLLGAGLAAGLTPDSPRVHGPAGQTLQQDPRAALAAIRLMEHPPDIQPTDPGPVWLPAPDLLGSGGDERVFVAEIDNDAYAHLRFGDGQLGRAPTPDNVFTATYRVGNGAAGNVGAEAINHLVVRRPLPGEGALQVRNPLPAQGGTDPQLLDEVKLLAPGTFRQSLERAITADDYARLAERNPRVQRAAAVLRWSGGWYEVHVAVDPVGGTAAPPDLLDEITIYLSRYRRIGHDVHVVPARYVPLDIKLIVCVQPHYLRAHVRAALLAVFGTRLLPDGQRGFFHPDNLTFGEGIYLSRLVATAQAVPGVESAQVDKLERLYQGPNGEKEAGILRLGPLEVARLDNDRAFPEHGKLLLDLRGGR